MQGVSGLEKKGGTPGAVFPLPRAPGERGLDTPVHPSPGAPELQGPRDPGKWGRDPQGQLWPRLHGLTLPGAPGCGAKRRRGEERSRARGSSSHSQAHSRLCDPRQPTSLAAFNRRPPRPQPSGPAPSPSSGPAPLPCLFLPTEPPPPSSPRLSGSGSSPAGARSCPPRGADTWVLPLGDGAGALRPPPPRGPTASQRAAGPGTGAGRSRSPGRWAQCCGFPSVRAEGLGLARVAGATGAHGRWVEGLDLSVPARIQPPHSRRQLSAYARPGRGPVFFSPV